jgi:hypothetical protein
MEKETEKEIEKEIEKETEKALLTVKETKLLSLFEWALQNSKGLTPELAKVWNTSNSKSNPLELQSQEGQQWKVSRIVTHWNIHSLMLPRGRSPELQVCGNHPTHQSSPA